jgi:signal transduction histidine kinase
VAPPRLRPKILGPRSVRARIALACAVLFLVTGVAFVFAIYALVDHSLSLGAPQRALPATLFHVCQKAQADNTLKRDQRLLAQCQYFLGASVQHEHDLHELLWWSLGGLFVATIVAGILGWAAGQRILHPLHKVTVAARRASQERLHERINLGGPDDELKELADTFDDMLTRLDLAFASQHRFVANASHELRTPLTSMRTLIDVAMAKPNRTTEQFEALVGRLRLALGQSEATIDGLLTLARSDRGVTGHELVDLEAASQDALDQLGVPARTANITIDADLSVAQTFGDRILLERLVANLLDNAVRYNCHGGSVEVITGESDDEAYVTVVNTGQLVPESQIDSLFEPFTRLGGRIDNGHGVGLGLSIVSSVVTAHNGQLLAEALPDGGMRISARFRSAGNASDHHQPIEQRAQLLRDPEPIERSHR